MKFKKTKTKKDFKFKVCVLHVYNVCASVSNAAAIFDVLWRKKLREKRQNENQFKSQLLPCQVWVLWQIEWLCYENGHGSARIYFIWYSFNFEMICRDMQNDDNAVRDSNWKWTRKCKEQCFCYLFFWVDFANFCALVMAAACVPNCIFSILFSSLRLKSLNELCVWTWRNEVNRKHWLKLKMIVWSTHTQRVDGIEVNGLHDWSALYSPSFSFINKFLKFFFCKKNSFLCKRLHSIQTTAKER